VIERALALTDASELAAEDLPFSVDDLEPPTDPADGLLRSAAEQRLSLRDLEDRYIDRIMDLTGGNKVQAARILGIDRKTLYRRAERRAQRDDALPS
jgi:DNA-binding NtrC family response regulator